MSGQDGSGTLLVLEICWSDGSGARMETYGPWTAADDCSHLGAIQEFVREWRELTGCEPQRLTLSIAMDPAAWKNRMQNAEGRAGPGPQPRSSRDGEVLSEA